MVFGKLPAHGDFISRGIPPDDRESLDDWIAEQMKRARLTHGEAFRPRYDHAPVWRFAWAGTEETASDPAADPAAGPSAGAAPGASSGPWSGAIAPSTDRVGRRFPVIVGIAASGVDAALACEDQLYAALVEQWNVDQLHDALMAIPPQPEGDPSVSRWWTDGNDDFDPASLEGERPVDLIATMLTPRGEPSWG